MCANNYLGLADNKEIIAAVKKGLDERGVWNGIRTLYLRNPGHPQ